MTDPRAISSDASSNARALAEARDDLQQTKQTHTNYFSQWRAGRATHNEYDARARAAIIASTDHPKVGSWPGMQDVVAVPGAPGVRRWPRRVETPRPSPAAGTGANVLRSENYRQSQATAARGAADLAPAGFSYVRVLGRGGYGVALLFEMLDRDRNARPVVVKADLRGRGAEMRRERQLVLDMAGAAHMVQRVVLGGMPGPWAPDQASRATGLDVRVLWAVAVFLLRALRAGAGLLGRVLRWAWDRRLTEAERFRAALDRSRTDPADDGLDPVSTGALEAWWPAGPSGEARRLVDRRRDVLVLEFMKLGGLGKWVDKMSESWRTERFSEKVLWLVFECLLRSCIAMAYPERLNPGRVDARTRQVPVRTETVPELDPTIRNPLVHFDLDPENVLVGDNDDSHNTMPLLKVADLGLAEWASDGTVQDRSFMDPSGYEAAMDDLYAEERLWGLRMAGKKDRYLPEQSTEEWDYIPDLHTLRYSQTAGNYGAHSNIFHIGMIMFELITLNFPDLPLVARPYEFVIGGRRLTGWTYGHNLLETYNAEYRFDNASPSEILRSVVGWCLEHNPTKRPSLQALERLIRSEVTRTWTAETDDQTRRWATSHFASPPVPVGRGVRIR